MKNLVSLTLLGLLPFVAAAESPALPETGPLPEVEASPIGYETPQAALEALKAKPSAQIRQERGWTIVEDQEAEKVFALWSFTPQDHPAHPAAVKRITFEKDGAIYLDMKVLCGGSKKACDALVRDFQALNDRIRSNMQGSKP